MILPTLRNAQPIAQADVPHVSIGEFRECVLGAVQAGARLSALFGSPEPAEGILLHAVLANDADGTLSVVATLVAGSYPALTPECPQAHWFEREIAEQWGVRPVGHPWLKPIRFHAAGETVGVTDFFHMEGAEAHEVAVGPVHAGVIEPGHFRFQCHGENVYHLEISLGYQHRGVQRALLGGPTPRTLHYMETLAGDTTVGHAFAYSQAVEALCGKMAPLRALSLRGIALELERLANHTGDLGALAGDVGFLPTASYCGRIRGDFLNLTALLCGNRFGRSLVRPGGVGFDVDADRLAQLLDRLARAKKDVTVAVELLWDAASVLARFENTGVVSREACRDIGLVGPAARACGLSRDVRQDFPTGIFRFAQIPLSSWDTGDVFARALVRWLEIQRSLQFIRDQAEAFPEGPSRAELGPIQPDQLVVSLVEGWRGEICHVAMTDAAGRFAHYKIVNPSFHNWFGLALSLRGQAISDFPLCNKSFNLSYCGHDLSRRHLGGPCTAAILAASECQQDAGGTVPPPSRRQREASETLAVQYRRCPGGIEEPARGWRHSTAAVPAAERSQRDAGGTVPPLSRRHRRASKMLAAQYRRRPGGREKPARRWRYSTAAVPAASKSQQDAGGTVPPPSRRQREASETLAVQKR